MHPSRIFDKPLAFFDTPAPQLMVVGSLPPYEFGVAYEGRLSILNAQGACISELLENNLPPGSTVTVDNTTSQVVVRWPAYSPVVEHVSIQNGDFTEDDLTGWKDVRGNSWKASAYPPYPDSENKQPSYGSNRCALMTGVGRGDHVLESIKYPVVPGSAIMAKSLWDEGPSNKDNNNLWTAFAFFRDDGTEIQPNPWYQWYGDRIHDRTNKTKHWSTVNSVVPAGAWSVAVRLIAHRRNGRNRWIAVGNVQTSGLSYSTGVDKGDDFHLRIKVTDSANRVAYWEGIIPYKSVIVRSQRYPVYAQESLAISPLFLSASTKEGMISHEQSFPESLSIAPLFISASTKSLNWAHVQPPESLTIAPLFVSASTKEVMKMHAQPAEHFLSIEPVFVSASTKEVLVTTVSPTTALTIAPLFISASTSGT